MIKLKTAKKIKELYWPSFIEKDGAVFIENELKRSHGIPEDPMSAECYVNHTHILDHFNHDAMLDDEPWWNSEHEDFKAGYELAQEVAAMWACKLKYEFPQFKFVVICTRDDNPIIRFHMLRNDDDLYFDKDDLNEKIKNNRAKVIYTDDVYA